LFLAWTDYLFVVEAHLKEALLLIVPWQCQSEIA
jgi:hypothetical protein